MPGITHRYPDRVLFYVSHVCSMYCRHCTRKRKVGDVDSIPGKEVVREASELHPQQPGRSRRAPVRWRSLMLSDDYLDWI
ncbi:MAG: hypothetical protein R2864_11980 [Syntrophotaleaceae bacterium]